MKSFGVFLSGFIYSISSLLLIDAGNSDNLVIAASVGVLYVIVGLVYFLLFIHNVSTHIQASGLILRLQEEASTEIKRYCDFVGQAEIITEDQLQELIIGRQFVEIAGLHDGYIQEINYGRLQKIAQNKDLVICIKKVMGQFISSETRLMTI
jgi:uncharacterized membrane protein